MAAGMNRILCICMAFAGAVVSSDFISLDWVSASYSQRLLLFDAQSGDFRIVTLRPRNKQCVVCGDNPSIRELIDYEQFCGSGPNDKVGALQWYHGNCIVCPMHA